MSEFGRQVVKGAAWLVLLKLIDRGLGLVSTLFLARILVPADFGLVAMAMTILAALELLSSFSFDLALIQNQNAKRSHYDTAWTFALIFGCVNALFMVILAPIVASFYKEVRIEYLMYALAISPLIQGFENVGVVAFQKNLEMHKEFKMGLAKRVVGFVITLFLAFSLQSFWALVGGILCSRIANLLLSYKLHPYRPRFTFESAFELFNFSKWLLLNNILIFLNNRGTDFILGKISGAGALGLYSVSYELANLPTTELVFPISRAVFPGYARLDGDRVKLRGAFLKVIGLVAFLTIPAGAGIGLVAEPLVQLLLGPKWNEAVALVQILALFGIVRSLHGPTGSVFLALGKPRMVAILQCIQLILAISLMFYLVPKLGSVGAAWSIFAGACAAMLVSYCLLLRELNMHACDLFLVVWRPIAAVLAMSLVLFQFSNKFGTLEFELMKTTLHLVGLVGLGVATYVATVLACWYVVDKPQGTECVLMAMAKFRLRSIYAFCR